MALNANKVEAPKGKGSKQAPLEAGNYPARVVQVIDLGVQAQRPYQGQEKPPVQEIMITYELLDEFCRDEDGNEQEDKPRWISETMPLHSLKSDKAKSTKRYMALDPKQQYEGDFSQLLSIPCMVTIVTNPGKGEHAGKVFSNVAAISPMRPRDAQKAAELVNDPVFLDLDTCDMEVFNKLPDWLQDKIKGNLNYAGSRLEALLGGEADPAPQTQEQPPVQDDQDGEDRPW